METAIVVSVVLLIGLIAIIGPLVLGPGKISDDVMQQSFGDVPHMRVGE